MKKINNEFKVGLFIILCLLGLFYLTYSTGKLNLKKAGYNVYVVFNECAGLQNKAPVMLNGVEVGKVEEIKMRYDNDKTEAVLKLWIDEKARIRENPFISIKTLGLMGEKYIQIASTSGSNFIQPGAVLYGKPFMDLDALLEQAQSISKDLSAQITKLTANLNSTVEDNKGSISAIVKNLETASKNFEEFSADIKSHPWKLLFKAKEKPEERRK
jgi:phospholipid/cholesterol/gamma-HCH transport system substrate-binding protein